METKTSTKTTTSVARRGDRIIIREFETVTTTEKGKEPQVKVSQKVKEYNVFELPDDLREELGDIAKIDTSCPIQAEKLEEYNKKKKELKQKLKEKSSQSIESSDEEPTQRGSSRNSKEEKVTRSKITGTPIINEMKDLKKMNKDCVTIHNSYRKKHGVPPLVFSQALADYAQEWAVNLAQNNKFEHRKDRKYGENLYMYYSTKDDSLASAEDACKNWYAEMKDYTFGKEPAPLKAGHFTQMIWKETREVGMGRAKSSEGKQIIVANYNPMGNFIGAFASNVPKPI